MGISIAGQTIVFLKAILLGMALSVIYDMLRVIRILTHAKRVKTAVLDSLFCIISGVAFFLFVVFPAEGEARSYILLGAFFGAGFYFMTMSKMIVKIGLAVSNGLIKISYPPRRLLKKTAKSLRGRLNTVSFETKTLHNIKKYFNFSGK